jgi:hypothetical protein
MRKTIAALAFAAAVSAGTVGAATTTAAASPASSQVSAGHHRPCPPRNKHCITQCYWVQTATIGSVPHLICVTTRRV